MFPSTVSEVFGDLISPKAPPDGRCRPTETLPSTEAVVACNYFPCLHDKQTLMPPTYSVPYQAWLG